MTFTEQILASLERSGDAVVLQEMRDGQAVPLSGRQLDVYKRQHLAMMEEEFVRRRRWITQAEFLDRLATANLFPRCV